VIAYELLVGASPFEAPSVDETWTKILDGSSPRPSQVRPLPAALDDVFSRSFRRDPTQRYPSIAAMLSELDAALSIDRLH
jgi:serine/threonine protein kinase